MSAVTIPLIYTDQQRSGTIAGIEATTIKFSYLTE